MWVKLGELPETAILARFVGTADRTLGALRQRDHRARMGDEVDDMEALCHLTVTSKPAKCYLILAPNRRRARLSSPRSRIVLPS